jgi:FAD/FMN-containing dehydrogenase
VTAAYRSTYRRCAAHESIAPGSVPLLRAAAFSVISTGVGGLSLGGGFGRLARKYGLTLDNIMSVDIVSADGVLRRASAEENPDLYWGIRGGGGNFGVVTSFEFGLHEMGRTVIAGDVVFPTDRARDVFRFYADYSREAPDELSLDLIMSAPPAGKPGAVIMHAVYSGDHSNAESVLAPIRKLGEPLANTIGPVDYVALQRSWDNSDPRHGGDYLKSGFVADIDGAQIDAIVDGFEADPERATTFFYQQSGGAINRVTEDATAFANRNAINSPAIIVAWNSGADPEPHIGYIRDYETQARINKNYRGNYQRLVEIKDRFDPGNLFRLNANVRPSESESL